MAMQPVVACMLGRVAYGPAHALQQRLQQRLVEAKRADAGDPPLPHVLLVLEHPPVYTLGKSGDAGNVLLSEDALAQRGATFERVGRGGDVTFHGPGQLVAYPLLDLDRFMRDLHRYLRALEETVIQACAAFGVVGRRVDGRTGVWVGPDARGEERKICAMGVRCSRWVTMHGLALNVTTDLSFFDHIVPCGIADRGVTSLAREAPANGAPATGVAAPDAGGSSVSAAHARHHFLGAFAEVFDATLDVRRGDDARRFLQDFLEEEAPLSLPATAPSR